MFSQRRTTVMNPSFHRNKKPFVKKRFRSFCSLSGRDGVSRGAEPWESNDGEFVLKTLERAKLWDVQTPQVIRPEILKAGFDKVEAENLEVTDDVSIVEALGERVQVTPGSYFNLKVTTPEDMFIAERLMTEQGAAVN